MESETASSPHSTEATGPTTSKKIASLFQPGMLLAAQYLDESPGKTLLGPEKRLMLAVLANAIDGFHDNHSARCGNKKRRFDEVQRWIFESPGDWVFGFENICSALGFSPEYIRQGLLRWKNQQLSNCSNSSLSEGTNAPVRRKPLPKLARAS
jgi:hypothetical protein